MQIRCDNFASMMYPNLYDGINLRKTDVDDVIYRKLDRPGLFEGLKPIQELKYVKDWLDAKEVKSLVVTITLRDYAFDTGRNSDTEAWSSFTSYLRNTCNPIVVPDTDNAFSKKLVSKAYLFLQNVPGTWVYELHFMRPLI